MNVSFFLEEGFPCARGQQVGAYVVPPPSPALLEIPQIGLQPEAACECSHYVTRTCDNKWSRKSASKTAAERWIQQKLLSALSYHKCVSFVEQLHQYIAQIPIASLTPV